MQSQHIEIYSQGISTPNRGPHLSCGNSIVYGTCVNFLVIQECILRAWLETQYSLPVLQQRVQSLACDDRLLHCCPCVAHKPKTLPATIPDAAQLSKLASVQRGVQCCIALLDRVQHARVHGRLVYVHLRGPKNQGLVDYDLIMFEEIRQTIDVRTL